MKNRLLCCLLFLTLFSFDVFSQKASIIEPQIIKENEALRSNNFAKAEVLLEAYRTILRHKEDGLSKKTVKNLELFDAISISKDGTAGWGRNRISKEIFLLNADYTPLKSLGRYVLPFEGNCFITSTENGSKNILDSKGKIVYSSENLISASNDTWIFSKGGKYGVFANAKVILPAVYNSVEASSDAQIFTLKMGDKYGFADKRGTIIIPFQYESASAFSNSMAAVKSAGNFGFINQSGEIIIPFVYEEAKSFVGNSARVKKNGKWALINIQGKAITDFSYDELFTLNADANFIHTIVNGKNGYLSQDGKTVLEPVYDELSALDNNIVRCHKNGFWLLYNVRTKEFSGNSYEIVPTYFLDGIGRVQRNGKYGFVDSTLKEFVLPEYDYTSEFFFDGLAKVQKGNKIGYVNRKNELVIPMEFDVERSGKEGVLVLNKGVSTYLFKTSGEFIRELPNDFRVYDRYYNGLIRYSNKSKQGYLNSMGEVAIPAKFDYVPEYHTGKAAVRQNDKWGCIGWDGKEITPFNYLTKELAEAQLLK